MKTAKILGGIAIGLGVIAIVGVAIVYFKNKNNNGTPANARTIDTDIDSVVE